MQKYRKTLRRELGVSCGIKVAGRGEADVQVVDEFTYDGACGDDGETDPNAPDVSAEDSDDLVSEQLRGTSASV